MAAARERSPGPALFWPLSFFLGWAGVYVASSTSCCRWPCVACVCHRTPRSTCSTPLSSFCRVRVRTHNHTRAERRWHGVRPRRDWTRGSQTVLVRQGRRHARHKQRSQAQALPARATRQGPQWWRKCRVPAGRRTGRRGVRVHTRASAQEVCRLVIMSTNARLESDVARRGGRGRPLMLRVGPLSTPAPQQTPLASQQKSQHARARTACRRRPKAVVRRGR